jgi:hypothetical protein
MVFNKQLRGSLNTQDPGLGTMLLENFVSYLDWSFISMGQYDNISSGDDNIYGGDKEVLKRKKNPNKTDGTIYSSYRSNWVWETGVYPTSPPIDISGVFIDGGFYGTGNATYPFNIDYANGEIVFDNAIPSTGTISVEYSAKDIKVTASDGIPFLRQIQQNSFRVDNPTFDFFGSGDWMGLSETRLQLPLVGVKVVSNKSHKPYQLGGGQDVSNDIIFYIFTEQEWEADNLCGVITDENDRAIELFDSTKVGVSGIYPFDENGYLVDNARASGMYPHMIDNHKYSEKCYINNAASQEIKELNPGLWMGVARFTATVPRKNL